MTRARSLAARALLLAFSLAACAEPPGSRQEPPTGTIWSWTGIAGSEPVRVAGPARYTLELHDDGRFAMRADCNTGGGTYELKGAALRLRPGPMTLAACPDGSRADRYLAALETVTSWARSGDGLSLGLGGGATMEFVPLPASPSRGGSEALGGTEWTVVGVNNGRQGVASVPPGAGLTVRFGRDGSLTGSAGCNTFRGTYEVDGGSIAVPPAASTEMMCMDEGVMERERQLLDALSAASTWEIAGDRLQLRGAEDELRVDLTRR